MTFRCRTIFRLLFLATGATVAILTVASAYGGVVNPAVTTIPAILAMTFPAWLTISVLLLIINLFTIKKAAILQAVAIAASTPAIAGIMPLNICPDQQADTNSGDTFSFMTYNVFQLTDWTRQDIPYDRQQWEDENARGFVNPTMTTILRIAPDIACLQELPSSLVNKWIHLTTLQADSLKTILPNSVDVEGEAVYSRFPLRPIVLRQPESRYCRFGAAVADIHGQKVLLVSVHFESIGLNNDDKALFHELTEGEATSRSDLGRVRRQLLSKLSQAFRNRAIQAQLLRSQIDSLNIENVIIAGDFNDIPGCYALRLLCRDDFHTVFSTAGRVTRHTYHANRFYFHIDHILYRGNLRPLSYTRLTPPHSDHYPILTNFLITPPAPTGNE